MSLFRHPSFDEKYQPGDPPSPENQASEIIISPDTRRVNRMPPGQSRTRKWPILDASGPPQIDLETWHLDVFGLVERPMTFSIHDFLALPQIKVFSDFHCVTRWSRLGNVWSGVATKEIARLVGIKAEAQFVLAHAYDNGWTTNIPVEYFMAEDVLLSHAHDDQPISVEHGGPVRLIAPQLYAWKSAKWVRALEFISTDKPGYWEGGGYHMLGDPWSEQRYRWD